MKLAIIGSRGLFPSAEQIGSALFCEVTEIVSGGARGVDSCARAFAEARGIPYRDFLPDYAAFGRAAPILRNLSILDYADAVLAFWDGASRGTAFMIDRCKKQNKPLCVIRL